MTKKSKQQSSYIFLIIKPTRCTKFLKFIYFWNKILYVLDSFSVLHQDQDGTASWSCSQAVSRPVCHTPLLCVQWKTHDDGQRNCPKHVEFYSKNKFEKLVHLVRFIIRIYYDERSPEHQNRIFFLAPAYGNSTQITFERIFHWTTKYECSLQAQLSSYYLNWREPTCFGQLGSY